MWTNVACHLWLRYTDIEPVKHLEPVLRRGLEMHVNPRFCFVGWQELEQHEAGDTTHHSFNLHPIPTYGDIWLYTVGDIGGVRSNSTSPIMHYPLDAWRANMWREQRGLSNSGMAVSYSFPRSQRFLQTYPNRIAGFRIYCYGIDPKYSVTFGIYASGLWNAPTGNPLVYTTLAKIPYKRIWPDKGFFFVPIPEYPWASSEFYHLVCWGDPRYPNDTVFWWSRWPLPPDHNEENSFYSLFAGPPWVWFMHGVSVLQYQAYDHVKGAMPCDALPWNITP